MVIPNSDFIAPAKFFPWLGNDFLNENSNTEVIPSVGDFYVFRADHAHGVYPFRAKDPNGIRRSMSFNFTCVIHEELEGPNFQVTGSDVK